MVVQGMLSLFHLPEVKLWFTRNREEKIEIKGGGDGVAWGERKYVTKNLLLGSIKINLYLCFTMIILASPCFYFYYASLYYIRRNQDHTCFNFCLSASLYYIIIHNYSCFYLCLVYGIKKHK